MATTLSNAVKKRIRRGKRGAGALERRALMRPVRASVSRHRHEAQLVIHEVAEFPCEFLFKPKGGQRAVRERFEPEYGAERRTLAADGPVSVMRRDAYCHVSGFPSILARRFDLSKADVHRLRDLERLFDEYAALPQAHGRAGKPDQRSNAASAQCFGVWRRKGNGERVTEATAAQAHLPQLRSLLDGIRTTLAPVVVNWTRRYFPEVAERNARVYEKLLTERSAIYERYPFVDFGGAFFAVAVKEGLADTLHLDMNDDVLAWVMPLGDCQGVTLWIPQLGLDIPLRAGQVVGFLGRLLAHAAIRAPGASGRRIMITGFTCAGMSTWAGNSPIYSDMAARIPAFVAERARRGLRTRHGGASDERSDGLWDGEGQPTSPPHPRRRGGGAGTSARRAMSRALQE